ncbi:MAG: SRPBCC family protein [Blastocatellia bacterium]
MERQRFIWESEVPASPEEVFAWHEAPGAVEKLTPPWEKVQMVERGESLAVGTRVVFRVQAGPFWKTWVAEHVAYDPPYLFADQQREGPFAYWLHRHRFERTERGTTRMIDEIEYTLPLGWLGQLGGGIFTRAKLTKMFTYRHQVVLDHFRRVSEGAKRGDRDHS